MWRSYGTPGMELKHCMPYVHLNGCESLKLKEVQEKRMKKLGGGVLLRWEIATCVWPKYDLSILAGNRWKKLFLSITMLTALYHAAISLDWYRNHSPVPEVSWITCSVSFYLETQVCYIWSQVCSVKASPNIQIWILVCSVIIPGAAISGMIPKW